MGGQLPNRQHRAPGQFFFAFPEQIAPCLDNTFIALAQEKALSGEASPEEFCIRAAYCMGELNAIHPFRDGNGRTQREFIRQLGLRNGYPLHWSRITRIEMSEASATSFQQADNSGLAAILRSALDPGSGTNAVS